MEGEKINKLWLWNKKATMAIESAQGFEQGASFLNNILNLKSFRMDYNKIFSVQYLQEP